MTTPHQTSHQDKPGAIAMADSLSLLRQVISAASTNGAVDLITGTVDALMSHPDIDGCELFIEVNTGATLPSQEVLSRSRSLSPNLKYWIDTAVTPLVMETGELFKESTLQRRKGAIAGTVLAQPIRKSAVTLGCLTIWNHGSNSFLPWHETLLDMVAQLLALALPALIANTKRGVGATISTHAILQTEPSWQAVSSKPEPKGRIDTLTGLADKPAFEYQLQRLLGLPTLAQASCFVLYLNIDRFRLIQNYGGDLTAERVIRTLTEVLRRQCGTELALARLGIDEFGLIVERLSLDRAVALAESLIAQVDAFTLSFSGQRYDVSISVGIAPLKHNSRSGTSALQRAMRACSAAKSLGGGLVEVYHARLDETRDKSDDGLILNQLTHALKNDGLELFAQAISTVQTTDNHGIEISGMYEILLRLRDENGELRSAGTFLPLAERYGLSVKLDRWVIHAALHQIAEASSICDTEHRFTLNLSGHSIDNHQLLEFILEQFEASGVAPERICFEITETAAISDITAAKEFVEELGKAGCQFALDDFGSGHASFLYLRDLPVDYLKIDGELVRKVVDDPLSQSLVATIQGVAQLMGLQTIAECVESEEINKAIELIGCDYVQGYWVGAPRPLADILSKPPKKGLDP